MKSLQDRHLRPTPPPSSPKRRQLYCLGAFLPAGVALISLIGCQQPAAPASNEAEGPSITQNAPAEDATRLDPVKIPAVNADPNRWLFVEAARDGAQGGWAEGSFDRKRNKITIQTKDVRRFALDTGRIRINWDRPVVLKLDGTVSELRRRDYSVLHFELTKHGQWIVKEP